MQGKVIGVGFCATSSHVRRVETIGGYQENDKLNKSKCRNEQSACGPSCVQECYGNWVGMHVVKVVAP